MVRFDTCIIKSDFHTLTIIQLFTIEIQNWCSIGLKFLRIRSLWCLPKDTSGLILGIGKGFLRVLEASTDATFDLIPVDVIANSHIVSAWHVAANRSESPLVVNCTSTNAVSYTLNEYLDVLQKMLEKESGFPNAFRETRTSIWIVKQRLVKEILSIYEHYVPAVFLDLVLLLRGKKPRLVSAYRFLDQATKVSKHFILNSWHYDTNNFEALEDPLDKEDRN
ncbi:fatty acyl-CoA reductase wat, partial [Nephila pilipes]